MSRFSRLAAVGGSLAWLAMAATLILGTHAPSLAKAEAQADPPPPAEAPMISCEETPTA